jgi:SAM-dependent methyltransferase
MAQNIYDDPGFFTGYAQLRRSRDGLDGAPEWPSLRALLPDMRDKRVVDLGCGYGWFARWASGEGAASVLALDVSGRMLERAREINTALGIQYNQADLDALVLPEASFDLAYSSLAFHYIADVERAFATIRGALVPGGRLVFSTEHPIFMAPSAPDWTETPEGRRIWPLDGYGREGERRTDWLADGVVKYHRTLGTTMNALIAAGFTIAHVEDWLPSSAQLAADPSLAPELDRPTFLIVSAVR